MRFWLIKLFCLFYPCCPLKFFWINVVICLKCKIRKAYLEQTVRDDDLKVDIAELEEALKRDIMTMDHKKSIRQLKEEVN